MKKAMDTLQENTIAALVFRDDNGLYLTCKHDYINDNIGVPMRKFEAGESQWAPYTAELINLMEKEFGVRTRNLGILMIDRIPYALTDKFVIGNCVGYMVKRIPDYKGKLPPKEAPTGFYKEVTYRSFAEIQELMKAGNFNTNSYDFIAELEAGA